MTSGYPGDFFYGRTTTTPTMMGGNQTGVVPFGLRQQQQAQPQHTQLQQGLQQGGVMLQQDQIGRQRADMLIGKRSFNDYQSYQQQQQQIQLLHQQQQQQQLARNQQQQVFSYLQNPQQQQQQGMSLQHMYLMRSVKQRSNNNNINGFASSSPISPLSPTTIDLVSPTHNNNNINIINNNINNYNNILGLNNNNSSTTRFGVPVYQQPRHQTFPLINNNILTLPNNINNPLPTTPVKNNLLIGGACSTPVQSTTPESGSGSGSGSLVVNENSTPGSDQSAMDRLNALEKHLLGDDYQELELEGDAVSSLSNTEWSRTYLSVKNNHINPSPSPDPATAPAPQPAASTSCSNNNNGSNNNNMISPSPTSSSSSCCSTSAAASGSPPTMTTTATPAVTAPAKELIVEAAGAISDGKTEVAMEVLGKLGQAANPKGNSEQRLAHYMMNALRSRVCPSENPPPVMELYGKEQAGALYSLYDISPCFKFALLAANLVMLEAITCALHEECERIHVVDFDVGHGGQYVNLLRALAERRAQSPRGAVEMRITIVETELGTHVGVPDNVKDGLVSLAEKVGIELKFVELTRSIHELSRESLGCVEGEAVVVNFAFKLYRVPDESVSMENLRDELLRRVKGISPRAVTLVEQDMNGNTAPFMTRVNEACGYYGALFDSLDSTLPRDHSDRGRVEEGLGRKMANSIACEGRERVERAEVFGKWRARMGMAGFELKPLSQSVAESMRAKLNSARGGNPGFTVKEENGGVGFGWMGRSLTVASAWR